MADQVPLYIIHCWRPYQNCYYGIGINICNIDFANFDEVALVKLTIRGKHTFKKNLFPYFLQFQRALKLRFSTFRSPRTLLSRETGGLQIYPSFRQQFAKSKPRQSKK